MRRKCTGAKLDTEAMEYIHDILVEEHRIRIEVELEGEVDFIRERMLA